jgi:hypothetical protein
MNKYLVILVTFFFASSVWAFQVPPQPEKCPGTALIQKTAFMTAKKLTDGSYGAIQLGGYDTKEVWAFVIAELTATSAADAIAKATTALASLAFISGPTYYADNNIWACFYSVEGDYPALALTPLPAQALNTEMLFKTTQFR